MTITGKQPLTRQTKYLLFAIILFTLITRLIRLDFESLWLDEIHTMNEADPSLSWKELLRYLNCCDQHPPMHFFISKICFQLFGHTALVARFPSVIAGVLSIWAIFCLGREMRSQRAGLIAALITAVNIFHLQYSQEARNYIFAFLFAILSFLWLVRLLKQLTVKNSVVYGIMTVLFLYTHYFSLFAVASQVVIIAIFFFAEAKENKGRFFRIFLISALIIALGYLPWIPYLLSMTSISSFWISPIKHTFWFDFFFDYFSNVAAVKMMALAAGLFYIGYSFYLGKGRINFRNLRQRPAAMALLILASWIFITQLIPYLRSIMLVPMLLSRYTIVVLPAFLLAIAFGFDMIPNKMVRTGIVTVFVFLSVWSILFKADYYQAINKTQFREMQRYVVDNNKENYPVINERTNWHQAYYFKHYKSTPPYLPGPKVVAVDSILHKATPRHDVKGFWIIGAHGELPLTPEERVGLDTAYNLVLEQKWLDAWAQKWIRKEKP